MSSSFDLVRSTLGESAGPDLVAAVEQLSLSKVDDLAESILDLPRSQPLRTRPVTHLWPLIPLRASLFFDHLNHESPVAGYSPTGVQLTAATNPRLSGTGTFSTGIVRALLYSHGLAIEDPLSHAAEMHLSQASEVREIARLGVSAAVASLSEIAQLLDGDVVELFYTGGDELNPAGQLGDRMLQAMDAEHSTFSVRDAWDEFELEFVSGLTAPLRTLWAEIRAGNRAPSLDGIERAVAEGNGDLAETFVDVVRLLNPRSMVENAVAATSCTVAAIQLLGGSHDVLCATPLMSRLLFVGTPDPVDQVRVAEIARTQVPNIEALAPTDLVALRQSSDALATWRDDLARALDFADRSRASDLEPDAIQTGVEEMLAEARNRVSEEARKTRVWTPTNALSFVAGGLGGAAGAAVGGTLGSMAGGAGGGVLAAFVQAASQQRRVPVFLDRHYLAFERVPVRRAGE